MDAVTSDTLTVGRTPSKRAMADDGHRAPHPVDVAIGRRIRVRRVELGWSQPRLASELSVSYQQLQKYENGSNRASGSMLQQIADAMHIPVADLFPREMVAGGAGRETSALAYLTDDTAIELLISFAAIKDKSQRRAAVELIRSLKTFATAGVATSTRPANGASAPSLSPGLVRPTQSGDADRSGGRR